MKTTIQWLQQNVNQVTKAQALEGDDGLGSAESSSATAEISPIMAPRSSRKRNQDGTPVSPSKILPAKDFDVQTLFGSVCGAMREVVGLMDDLPDQSRGFAVEYIKAALKISSEDAAAMLGAVFGVTRFMSQKADEPLTNVFDSCIKPFLAILDLRSEMKNNSPGHMSFVCSLDRINHIHAVANQIK